MHLPFGTRLAGQLLVSAKSPVLAPLIVIAEMLRLLVPVLAEL
jgi:hypothetical protein